MFWDRVAPLYDLAVNTLNRRVYDGTGTAVARLIRPGDTVLECACGTGAISAAIAPTCARVVATDYSEGMLKQARKKLAKHSNVTVEQADITDLHYADDSFDAVVAGNVIHLLPEPGDALKELKRVVRPGGTIIRAHIRDSQEVGAHHVPESDLPIRRALPGALRPRRPTGRFLSAWAMSMSPTGSCEAGSPA